MFGWLKSFENTKEPGPLVSRSGCLAGHTSHSHARNTAHGDVAVTIHRRWPPPTDPRCIIPYTTASRSKCFFPPLSTPFHFLTITPRSAMLLACHHSLLVSRSCSHLLFDSFRSELRQGLTVFFHYVLQLELHPSDPYTGSCRRPPVRSLLRASHHRPNGA
jgi:hypothetical protein